KGSGWKSILSTDAKAGVMKFNLPSYSKKSRCARSVANGCRTLKSDPVPSFPQNSTKEKINLMRLVAVLLAMHR
ncbi:MAG: hypothetical protein ACO3F7_00335, partial [Luteolibacter sp.]